MSSGLNAINQGMRFAVVGRVRPRTERPDASRAARRGAISACHSPLRVTNTCKHIAQSGRDPAAEVSTASPGCGPCEPSFDRCGDPERAAPAMVGCRTFRARRRASPRGQARAPGLLRGARPAKAVRSRHRRRALPLRRAFPFGQPGMAMPSASAVSSLTWQTAALDKVVPSVGVAGPPVASCAVPAEAASLAVATSAVAGSSPVAPD